MEYTTEVIIDLPRSRVIELFDDADNLKKWQPGLQNMEHVSGEPGQPGAKTRLVYDEGGRTMEMVETIVQNDLPERFVVTYEAKNVYNLMDNIFHETADGKTRWVSDTEFRFSGFMAIMALFMRGAFPKETLKSMNLFKAFAEGV